jgi:hypothetical protein
MKHHEKYIFTINSLNHAMSASGEFIIFIFIYYIHLFVSYYMYMIYKYKNNKFTRCRHRLFYIYISMFKFSYIRSYMKNLLKTVCWQL